MAWWADVERALCDVPHAIVGAVAANAYAPPRATADIDCAIATADFYRAEAALRGARWKKGGDFGLVLGTSRRDSAGDERSYKSPRSARSWRATATGRTSRTSIS